MVFAATNVSGAETIKVAITVDDLPVHGSMPADENRYSVAEKMLKAFEKHKLSGVYGFINAKKVDQDPETLKILKLWQKHGQALANHTYSHGRIEKMAVDDYTQDIIKNEDLLKKLTQEQEFKYFRYPFLREGETKEKRSAVRNFLQKHNYQIAQVTIDFDDWYYNEPYAECRDLKAEVCIKFLKDSYLTRAYEKLRFAVRQSKDLFGRDIRHILLLHIGAFSAEMMDELLDFYKKKGVEFISLKEAVKDPVYKVDPEYVAPKSKNFLDQIEISKGL